MAYSTFGAGVSFLLVPAWFRFNRKKLVAKGFRREGVYNRAENPSETFFGEEEQRSE